MKKNSFLKPRSWFLLLVGLVASFSQKAIAYDFEVDGIYYSVVSLSDLTCSVVSGDTQYEGEVVIPGTVSYKNKTLTVVSIGNSTFQNNTRLTSVITPNTITSIGSQAFYGCESLAKITIGHSVISIGASAFSNCTKLENIIIPASVETIGRNAFYNCI